MLSAIDIWRNRVEQHTAQSIKVQRQQEFQPSEDGWPSLTKGFNSVSTRNNTQMLSHLYQLVAPEATVLDVGGAVGSHALDLAMRSRQVTVVEQNARIAENLRQEARVAGMANVSVIGEPWLEAEPGPASIVLCSGILHGVANVVPFLRKLEQYAKHHVLVLAYIGAPPIQLLALWRTVHGWDRVNLPETSDLLNVLGEMEIHADLALFDAGAPMAFPSREAALAYLRQFLQVSPNSLRDQHLQVVMRSMLMESSGGYYIRGLEPRSPALISWKPSSTGQPHSLSIKQKEPVTSGASANILSAR